MPKHTLTERVEVLEQKVEVLETLPARVEAVELQIVQLRTEMRSGFSDVRQEMAAMAAGLREEIRAGDEALRTELTREIRKSEEGLRTELIMEIRKGDEDTRRYMRMLHEEVISKIATIEEGPRRKK
jgi:wyosine [tRNA(Phe)-imidazoG37] synthetase (radical SAM superfamily)